MLSRWYGLLLGSLLAGSALAAPGRLGPAWSALYDAPFHLNEVQAIVVDGNANVYVTGYSGTSFSPAAPPDPRQPEITGVTVKYSSNGQRLWVARHLGLTDAIALDGSGGVYVAGYGTVTPDQGLDYQLYKLDAATGAELWSAGYDSPDPVSGPFRHDAAQALAVDASGNPVVTGISTGTGQQTDIATVKYNGATGNLIWSARYDGAASQRDAGLYVAIDGDGDVLVAGTEMGEETLTNIVTLKYDGSTGNELWASTYDGPAHLNEGVAGLRVAGDGSVFVAGTAQVTAEDFDLVAIRYAPATGDADWVKLVGTEDREEGAAALALGPGGSLYVTGTTTRNIDSDLLTVRLDPATGNEVWKRTYNGQGRETLFNGDFASDLCVDNSGNVYVVGAAVITRTEDLLVLKYNPSGDQLWASWWDAKRFPDYAAACAVDESGNLYVAGRAGYENDILGHGAFATLKFAPNGAAGAQPRPDRSAPKVTLTETLRERQVSRRHNGQTVLEETRSGTFNLTVDLPLTGVDPTTFGPNTRFHFRLGNLDLSRELGDDPRYRPGKTAATFIETAPNAQGRQVKALTVTLNWARGRLRVTARSTAAYTGTLLAGTFLDVETGLAAGTPAAQVELGELEQAIEFSYTGKVTTNPSRDDRFLLSSIQLRASGAATAVPFVAPKP